MHRGVREFVRWMEDHREQTGLALQPPAQARDIQAIEHHVGSPLPADLRLVLGRFNGAVTPAGTLLTAAPGPGATIEAALKEVASQRAASFLDPDLLLPFHRTEHGTVLAFDRSAAPVADTWPIVDYDPDSGEVRLVHRTFDGWCRLCVNEWTTESGTPFDLDKYLRQGQRHVEIEPDVSIAHVTVGHALRRAGRPEEALASYLRGARCVPAIPWADWEALKIASILGDLDAIAESGGRLAKRTPEQVWEQRGTTPSRVAYVIARALPTVPEGKQRESLMRALDNLEPQSRDPEDRSARDAILAAARSGEILIPQPWPAQETAIPTQADVDAWWAAMVAGYQSGQLRDDDLVLDPTYDALRATHSIADLLRIRRDFG
ncbi:SMI1/KNR4 family protein [Sandaracinus amylolyticus]|nr:SMI1/KNR4 family protein [Sandaracinus amylolyticus]